MKKLPEYTSDDNMFFYMNALVDLVNSQQEAIEKLRNQVALNTRVKINDDGTVSLSTMPYIREPADDKPKAETNDTHRTVTLRIPKGMTFGWAMIMAYAKSYKHDDWVSFFEQSDTDLQKALDEVQPNE